MLADQGLRDAWLRRRVVGTPPDSSLRGDRTVIGEETGQLSNPPRRSVQRRLTDPEIDELVHEYQTGRTLADLASVVGIHRRTVAAHLEKRGVRRRENRRKMTDDRVTGAERRYHAGDSLAKVGSTFNVDAGDDPTRASPHRRHHPTSSRLELTPSPRRPHRTPTVSTRSGQMRDTKRAGCWAADNKSS